LLLESHRPQSGARAGKKSSEGEDCAGAPSGKIPFRLSAVAMKRNLAFGFSNPKATNQKRPAKRVTAVTGLACLGRVRVAFSRAFR
jgi:hypothetical protein